MYVHVECIMFSFILYRNLLFWIRPQLTIAIWWWLCCSSQGYRLYMYMLLRICIFVTCTCNTCQHLLSQRRLVLRGPAPCVRVPELHETVCRSRRGLTRLEVCTLVTVLSCTCNTVVCTCTCTCTCVGVSVNVSPVASGEAEDDGNLGHSESTASVGGQHLEYWIWIDTTKTKSTR